MKTYILRDPNSVEPQKAQFALPPESQAPRPSRRQDPALAATVDLICSQSVPTPPAPAGP